jgi:hypothetical protein
MWNSVIALAVQFFIVCLARGGRPVDKPIVVSWVSRFEFMLFLGNTKGRVHTNNPHFFPKN